MLRGVLRPVAGAYGLIVWIRNVLYRGGLLKSHKAGVPVLSVGNITAGGTGKTPLVAWLARLMVIHRMRPVILSRGYGKKGELDDENSLLARLTGEIPIVAEPNRVRGARRAIQQRGADVLVLDDGFQHRRIARDLDIVLIDALRPFGGGHLLPRGLLREPLSQLRRADALLLTRTALVTPERRDELKERLRKLAPRACLACCCAAPSGLRALGGAGAATQPVASAMEGRWGAFCGIGNPEGFDLTLRQLGCDVAFLHVFADHADYKRRQIEAITSRARDAGCRGVITTEKDAVKVERLLEAPPPCPIYALQIDLEITEGSCELTAAILAAIGKRA